MAIRERVITAVRSLDGAQLVQRPEPNAWSVGEVLEHLCVSDELYEGRVRGAIAAARRDGGAPMRDWKPSFLGGMLAKLLANPGKMKAPKAFQPGPTPRGGVLEAFLAKQLAVIAMMNEGANVDWKATRVGSPALPFFAPKMNLGDCFNIHLVHSGRHTLQIERIIGRL
jgi:hypothetical protein